MDEELTCEECESIFRVDYVDGIGLGKVQYCPYCGTEMIEPEE